MSQTISVGVVGPSHWSYMASVMTERLGQMRRTKRIDEGAIPPGVFRDACHFCRLALGETPAKNPPASLNAYVIAADAARAANSQGLPTSRDVKTVLKTYCAFLDTARQPRELGEADLPLVDSLLAFFAWLHSEGEAEAYEHGVRSEQLHFSLR